MRSFQISVFLALSLCSLAARGLDPNKHFDPVVCLQDARNLKAENPGHRYFQVPTGARVSPDSVAVTLEGCEDLCGIKWSSYPRSIVVTSIFTWIVPLCVLVGNLNFGKSGFWGNVAEIIHLLGDPIDVIWSLLDKLDAGRRYRRRFQDHSRGKRDKPSVHNISSDCAMVLYAIADFHGEGDRRLGDVINSLHGAIETEKGTVIEALRNAVESDKGKKSIQRASLELADIRVNNTLRIFLAVAAYLANLIGAWARITFGGPPESSARMPTMAFRLLYFWLIPTIVLSTAAGTWPSRRAGLHTLKRLEAELKLLPGNMGCDFDVHSLHASNSGCHIWLPEKYIRRRGDHRPVLFFSIAVLSVASAFATALAASWFTPTIGLGCGGVVILAYFGAWICSFLFTFLSTFLATRLACATKTTRRGLWRIIIVKDSVFVMPMITILFGACGGKYELPITSPVGLTSPQGWWNSCRCWSAIYSLGAHAYLDLNMDKTLDKRAKTAIPKLFAPAATVQVCLLCGMMWLGRETLQLDFWRNSKRDKQYESLVESGPHERGGEGGPKVGDSKTLEIRENPV
jgi:cation transporter-like permease